MKLLLLLGIYLTLVNIGYTQVVYIDEANADVTLTFTIYPPPILEYRVVNGQPIKRIKDMHGL